MPPCSTPARHYCYFMLLFFIAILFSRAMRAFIRACSVILYSPFTASRRRRPRAQRYTPLWCYLRCSPLMRTLRFAAMLLLLFYFRYWYAQRYVLRHVADVCYCSPCCYYALFRCWYCCLSFASDIRYCHCFITLFHAWCRYISLCRYYTIYAITSYALDADMPWYAMPCYAWWRYMMSLRCFALIFSPMALFCFRFDMFSCYTYAWFSLFTPSMPFIDSLLLPFSARHMLLICLLLYYATLFISLRPDISFMPFFRVAWARYTRLFITPRSIIACLPDFCAFAHFDMPDIDVYARFAFIIMSFRFVDVFIAATDILLRYYAMLLCLPRWYARRHFCRWWRYASRHFLLPLILYCYWYARCSLFDAAIFLLVYVLYMICWCFVAPYCLISPDAFWRYFACLPLLLLIAYAVLLADFTFCDARYAAAICLPFICLMLFTSIPARFFITPCSYVADALPAIRFFDAATALFHAAAIAYFSSTYASRHCLLHFSPCFSCLTPCFIFSPFRWYRLYSRHAAVERAIWCLSMSFDFLLPPWVSRAYVISLLRFCAESLYIRCCAPDACLWCALFMRTFICFYCFCLMRVARHCLICQRVMPYHVPCLFTIRHIFAAFWCLMSADATLMLIFFAMSRVYWAACWYASSVPSPDLLYDVAEASTLSLLISILRRASLLPRHVLRALEARNYFYLYTFYWCLMISATLLRHEHSVCRYYYDYCHYAHYWFSPFDFRLSMLWYSFVTTISPLRLLFMPTRHFDFADFFATDDFLLRRFRLIIHFVFITFCHKKIHYYSPLATFFFAIFAFRLLRYFFLPCRRYSSPTISLFFIGFLPDILRRSFMAHAFLLTRHAS